MFAAPRAAARGRTRCCHGGAGAAPVLASLCPWAPGAAPVAAGSAITGGHLLPAPLGAGAVPRAAVLEPWVVPGLRGDAGLVFLQFPGFSLGMVFLGGFQVGPPRLLEALPAEGAGVSSSPLHCPGL